MTIETTPDKITDMINELCRKITADEKPEYISVEIQEYSIANHCFPNVARMVRDNQGEVVNGWAIWKWANILIEAEAHAVWKSPEGRLIDITPHNRGEDKILFLPDNRVIYKNYKIASIRQALTTSLLIERLMFLLNERDQIMCNTPVGRYIISEAILVEINQIMDILDQEVKGNEFCPCQSGLKYKKCCGQ